MAAVGVGAAGMIDWPTGHIRWAPNNSYSDLPLQQLLAERSGLPAVVENDANAAAWAEAAVGAGAGLDNIIALTIGTGIGAGIILNGELQRGETGIAGEAGHIIVNPVAANCAGAAPPAAWKRWHPVPRSAAPAAWPQPPPRRAARPARRPSRRGNRRDGLQGGPCGRP